MESICTRFNLPANLCYEGFRGFLEINCSLKLVGWARRPLDTEVAKRPTVTLEKLLQSTAQVGESPDIKPFCWYPKTTVEQQKEKH